MKGMQEVMNTVEQVFVGSGKMDVVSILKADHRKVELLFSQWEIARSNARKQELLDQIIKELSVHTTVEEDLVYPLLEENDRKRIADRAREAVEEHHLLKVALSELSATITDQDVLKAKVTVVRELVRHHVKEEESTLLPALKRTGVDLYRLGREVLTRKQLLMGDVSRAGSSGQSKVRSMKQSSTRRSATASAQPTGSSERTASSKRSRSSRKSSAGATSTSTRSASASKRARTSRSKSTGRSRKSA